MIKTHKISDGWHRILKAIKKSEGFQKYIYDDSIQIPTIGYGFAIISFSEVPDGKGGKKKVYQEVDGWLDLFKEKGKVDTSVWDDLDQKRLDKIIEKLNNGDAAGTFSDLLPPKDDPSLDGCPQTPIGDDLSCAN